MKLVLKNDFTWDGLYWICDEAGERGESKSMAANLLKAGKNAVTKAGNAMDNHFETK